ncbi:MAG: Gfo/Idh/MocA family oxidoreductase [Planctomycetota bacterium]|nr:Gfo/Idh/MocA family oxidoreductase [Planctomycetota bacterium]
MQPRVLIVGVGSIGERHLRCFQNTGRCSVIFCEPHAELRAVIAQRYNLSEHFDDLSAAILAKPDAAVICTPAHLHVSQARQLASAGVHLLIEKPLGVDTAGIEPLLQTIESRKLVAGVAYVTRCHPLVQCLRDELQALGDSDPVVQATYTGGQDFPFFRPAYRDIYYARHTTGGGAIQDALTHSVNTMQWLLGPMTSLVADAQHQVLPDVDVEDTVHVLARHGDVMSSWSLNQHQRANEATIQIMCRKTMFKLEFHTQRLLRMKTTGQDWEILLECQLERDDSFVRQAEMFLDALDGSETMHCTIKEASQTLNACLAMLESNQARGWQEVT